MCYWIAVSKIKNPLSQTLLRQCYTGVASPHRPLVCYRDLFVVTGQAAGPCSCPNAGLVQARWRALVAAPPLVLTFRLLPALFTDLLWLL